MSEAAVATHVQPNQTKAVVQWQGVPVTITFQDVKGLICPPATDQEVAIFLKTCQSLQLNPFANECFLIKYDSRDKAAFVIAIDSYLKAAENNPHYDGCEAGIVLKDSGGKLELREGAFLLDEERPRLAGGWAKVYRKDRSRPTYVAVNKTECVKVTREGKPTQFWAEPKQPWMLRKSALKRALVEAFPSLFAGTLATAEVAADIEGTLPPAFQNGDDPAWSRFWVRAREELGLTKEDAHGLLGVDSVKELLEQGHDLGDIWEALVDRVRQSKADNATIDASYDPLDDEPVVLFDDPAEECPIDMGWLRDAIIELQWADVGKWLAEKYKVHGSSVRAMVENLTPEQKREFVAEVVRRGEGQQK